MSTQSTNHTKVGSYSLSRKQAERWVSDLETKLAFRLTPGTNPVYLDKKEIDNIMSILHILKEVESASIRVEAVAGSLNDADRDTAAVAATNNIDSFDYEWQQPVQERKEATRYWVYKDTRYHNVSVDYEPLDSQWGSITVFVSTTD